MLGVDQGATISLNGGESWTPWYNQPTGEFYRVATDHRFPYWVYGRSRTAARGNHERGNNGQITERDWFPVDQERADTRFPIRWTQTWFTTRGRAGAWCDCRKQRASGDISPAPVSFESKYRFNWTIPMAFSRRIRTCFIWERSFC